MSRESTTGDPTGTRAWVRTLIVAGLLGIPVAVAALLFLGIEHALEELVWHDVPDAADWTSPPWWYVIVVPAVGGALVAATLRLPGHGGHPAIEGLGLDPAKPRELVGVLLAALASLSFGLVVGPEAPLMALGLTLGLVALRRAHEEHGPALAIGGAFAAISTILGGPIVASLMLFELMTAARALPAGGATRMLLPGFVAAGTGAAVFTYVADWRGVDVPELAVPGLPTYDDLRLADLAWSIPLAVAVTLVVLLIRLFARELWRRASARPDLFLVGGGLAVGIVAVTFRALADRPVDLVLFSGQAALPAEIAETSGGVLALVLVAKSLAYGLSLGSGFRGGLIFPAVTVGVTAGALAATVLPGLDQTPAVMAGIAAGTVAVLPAPFTATLMAALLGGTAATNAAPIAIVAAATAWLLVQWVGRRVAADTAAEQRDEPPVPA